MVFCNNENPQPVRRSPRKRKPLEKNDMNLYGAPRNRIASPIPSRQVEAKISLSNMNAMATAAPEKENQATTTVPFAKSPLTIQENQQPKEDVTTCIPTTNESPSSPETNTKETAAGNETETEPGKESPLFPSSTPLAKPPLTIQENHQQLFKEDVTTSISPTNQSPSSPSYSSPPTNTKESAAGTPPVTSAKKRLSLLMSLRPPPMSTARKAKNYTQYTSTNTPSSILRRRCTPAKEGQVYDGTTREASAVEPTSDRHFDSLVAFAASSSSPANRVDVEDNENPILHLEESLSSSPLAGAVISQDMSIDSDEPIVIHMETLGERLKELFPQKYSRFISRNGRPFRRRNMQNDDLPPPCFLTRLIACYTIFREQQNRLGHGMGVELFAHENDVECSRPIKKARTKTSTISAAKELLAPVDNLLQAMVDLEWVISAGHEHRDRDEELKKDPERTMWSGGDDEDSIWRQRVIREANAALKLDLENDDGYRHKRRVQFVAFGECAVVRPPSDVLEGSYKPQEDCIKALTSVLDVVEEIFPQSILPWSTNIDKDNSPVARIVRDFTFYLENEFIDQCHDAVCVESLLAVENEIIPVGRIEKAARSYSKELSSLIGLEGKTIRKSLAVANNTTDNEQIVVPISIQAVDAFARTDSLCWEKRLANTTSQLVRYWLRTLLNPINDRSDRNTKSALWKKRLYKWCIITEPSEEETSSTDVLDDIPAELEHDEEYIRSLPRHEDSDKISSLLSNAVYFLYSYLDLDILHRLETDMSVQSWKDRLLKKIPDQNCCATFLCQQGLGSARKPAWILPEDWQDIEENLREATDFCAFHRRALFLERLLSLVVKADKAEHWNATVRHAGRSMWRLTSCRAIQPEDAHLAVLGLPLEDIVDRLRNDVLPLTGKIYQQVRANLRTAEKNFRLGMSTTKAKKAQEPHIGHLEDYWKQFLHPDTIFPTIWEGWYPLNKVDSNGYFIEGEYVSDTDSECE